jgi:ABC-2 type transport system permease protein
MIGSTVTGTRQLLRFVLRRDRVRTPVWVLGLAGLVILQAVSIEGFYPTQQDLADAAASMEGNPAFLAFQGPARQIDTLGGQVAWQIAIYGGLGLGLMSLFMVGRHTRAEEESERAELLRSAVVGRHAPITAALLAMVGANLAVALLVTVLVPATSSLGVTGSFALGAGMAGCGITFGALAAVTAQVSENTHVASGLAGALVALAFVLRAAGDVGNGMLTWLSPIGWVSMVQPFTGERWWVLSLFVGSSALLVALAFSLASHRDVGAGLMSTRPGPARAPDWLLHPGGLAWRLGRMTVLAWAVGLFVLGVAYGSVGKDIEAVIGDSEGARDFLAPGQGSLTDLYWVTTALMLSLISAGYAVMAAIRLRSEEAAGRAEPVLATAVARARWMASYVGLAFGGSALVLAASGAGTGLAYGVAIGDPGQVVRLTGVALAYAPAVWVLVGLAAAIFGLVPRAMVAVWGALTLCAVVGLFGPLLDLPAWVEDLSPFHHVPQVPATGLDVAPLATLTAVALGLTAVGLTAFRHRDLAT